MRPLSGRAIAALAALVLVLAPPPSAGQSSPKAALLEQSGFQLLAAGELDAAVSAFREAIRLDPSHAPLHLGLGVAAARQRRDADALVALREALRLEPTLTAARAVLGQVLKRTGDLDSAIREYETVVTERPGDAEARDTLERWKREADLHARMRLTVGDFFTIAFEGPEDEALAAAALESLERAYWRITDTLGVHPPEAVPVVLYSREAFRDITRSPPWVVGVFDGRIRVPAAGALANPEEFERVLAHEFAHALIRSVAPGGVPAWLSEGLATALESDANGWADEELARGRRVAGVFAPDASFNRLSPEDARTAYALSAVAARRLLDEAGGAAVANLLRDLGAGRPFEEAFLHRIQVSVEAFLASLATPGAGGQALGSGLWAFGGEDARLRDGRQGWCRRSGSNPHALADTGF